MNTIATLDLLPAARSSLTTRVLTCVGRFMTFAALALASRSRAALYGPKLVKRVPVVTTSDWSANPELIRQDVYMARCEAAAMYHHPWLNHVAEKLPGTAPVLLSACLTCGWEGHTS